MQPRRGRRRVVSLRRVTTAASPSFATARCIGSTGIARCSTVDTALPLRTTAFAEEEAPDRGVRQRCDRRKPAPRPAIRDCRFHETGAVSRTATAALEASASGQRESRRPRWLRVHAPTRTQVSPPLMTSVSQLATSRYRGTGARRTRSQSAALPILMCSRGTNDSSSHLSDSSDAARSVEPPHHWPRRGEQQRVGRALTRETTVRQ
jgi:hypothetical protein